MRSHFNKNIDSYVFMGCLAVASALAAWLA